MQQVTACVLLRTKLREKHERDFDTGELTQTK